MQTVNRAIKIVLAEDHKTVRTGLRLLIDAESDMKVIGEAGNGSEAIKLAINLQPDILMTDISMPGVSGLVAAATVKRIHPNMRIIALTRHCDKAYLQEMLQAGVSGFVLKQSESSVMLGAIRAVANGDKFLDPSVIRGVFEIVDVKPVNVSGQPTPKCLNDRETEILRRIARGYSNRQIAEHLETNVKTIESQKASALKKLSIKGRNEIVDYAILHGWLSPS